MPYLDQLLQQLRRAAEDDRVAAARELARVQHPRALHPLLQAATADPFVYVRSRAVYALGNLQDRRAVPPLVDMLPHTQGNLRASIVSALGRLGDPQAVPAMIQAVNRHFHTEHAEGHECYHCQTMDEAFTLMGPAAVEPLIATIQTEKQRRLHYRLVDTLGLFQDPRALPLFSALLTNRKYADTVRESAAARLGDYQAPQALDTLLAVVQDTSDALGVRMQAATALYHLAEQHMAADQIRAALQRVRDDPGDQQDMRVGAAHFLQWLSGMEGQKEQLMPHLDQLIQQLHTASDFERAAAALQLGHMQHPRALHPLLQAATADPFVYVRSRAVYALGNLQDRRAVPPLVDMLPHAQGDLRASIVSALGRLGDPQAVPAMIQALNTHLHTEHAEGHACDHCQTMDAAFTLMGPAVVEPLIATIQTEKQRRLHYRLVDTLGLFQDPRALPLFSALLTNRKYADTVRESAAARLGDYQAPQALDTLLAVVQDTTDALGVRMQAALVLYHLAKRHVAVEQIRAALQRVRDDPYDHPDVHVDAAEFFRLLS